MQTSGIDSAWASEHSRQAGTAAGSDFTRHLAQSGLTATSGGLRSGGQLLSDDMSRALASYSTVEGAAMR